jgi:hypothetical protein
MEVAMIDTHFKLVKIDETQYWSDEIKERVGKLYGVYLIDTNAHTYCCEVTPSYCAYFLYTTYDDPDDMDDLEAEAFDEMIRHADFNAADVSYFHVYSVKEFAYDFGEESHDEDDYKTVLDDVLEYCNANWLV